MFKRPTVFVLGAGASAAYGFPTGKELKHKILSKSDFAFMHNDAAGNHDILDQNLYESLLRASKLFELDRLMHI